MNAKKSTRALNRGIKVNYGRLNINGIQKAFI